MHTTSYCQIRL